MSEFDDGPGDMLLSDYATEPLLVQCAEKDSGGARCEALIASLDDPHPHHISDATIEDYLYRPFHIHIGPRGGYCE